MADRKYILPDVERIEISGRAADALLQCGDGDAALLYIYILRNHGAFSAEEAARDLRMTRGRVDSALAQLGRLQLVTGETAPPAAQAGPELPPDSLPEYTADDLSRELENGTEFPLLVEEVQRALGKILSSDELLRLLGIYDNLGLPPEVILHLVNHCIADCAQRSGSHRRPTMRYIEKAAYTWEREGVFTLEAAETYLRQLEQRRKTVNTVLDVLQIRDREPTAAEKRYIRDWLEMGFGTEALEMAYERTVLGTNKLSWPYMDKILRSWHEKGLHKPDEIRKGDGRPESKRGRPQNGAEAGPTPEQIARMKKLLKKIEP